MTEHTHNTYVAGCYRCLLGRDEVEAQTRQDMMILGGVMREMIESGAARLSPPSGDRTYWTLLLDSDARPKLSSDQHEAASNYLTDEDLDRIIALEERSD